MNIQLKIDLGVYLLAVFVVLMIFRNALRAESELEAKGRVHNRFPKVETVPTVAPFQANSMPEAHGADRAMRDSELADASTF